jgi:DNA replication protein DnaC
MTTPQLERIEHHCHRLRLFQLAKELTARLEQAAKRELSYAEFLDELLALEVDSKTEKHHQLRITMARFPFRKTLESFDFKFQPSIDVKLIRELAGGRYMASGDNLLLLRVERRAAGGTLESPHPATAADH